MTADNVHGLFLADHCMMRGLLKLLIKKNIISRAEAAELMDEAGLFLAQLDPRIASPESRALATEMLEAIGARLAPTNQPGQ
jgi:hypothetical protein